MTQGLSFNINTDRFRPGQQQAFDTIIDRIRNGHSHTAIVLPTRYGKTDVMRVSGLWLWRERMVSRAMVVVPNQFLRDQFVNLEKSDASLARYKVNLPGGMPCYKVERRPSAPFPPHHAVFCAITTQMVSLHKGFFSDWVDHEIATYGVPPVIYIDEAHTGSEVNTWGDSVDVLAKAGAFVVLLTATPYRADNKRIPGFEDILVEEKTRPVRMTKRRVDDNGEILVDIYEGVKSYYRLDAHHITTFRQVWDEEKPSPLCKVTRRVFSVKLSKYHTPTDEAGEFCRLGDLNERDSQQVLMPALKDPVIIRQACALLVEAIRHRKADAPETAAIVFVGNDEQSDTEVNAHAVAVQREIQRVNPRLVTMIATSGDGDRGTETIGAFAQGVGDVLIVKQMASVGLDIDRLKVCLDLSNIRTPAAFVQRLTRVCTIWERNNNPDDYVRTAIYICPDDIRGAALFQQFVFDQGGEARDTDWRLVGTAPAGPGEPEPPKPIYIVEDVVQPDVIEDTDRKQAEGTKLPAVTRLIEALPELTRTRTLPALAEIIDAVGISIPVAEQAKTRDMNAEEQDEITRINDAANRLTSREVYRRLGRPYRSGDREAAALWGRVSIDVWTKHKQRAGVAPEMDIKDIHDIATLRAIRHSMERERHENAF